MAAIQTAVSIPKNIRDSNDLGKIVLTAELKLVNPESESIYLGDGDVSGPSGIVHPRLQADHDTLVSLKELGLTEASSETVSRDRFKSIASALLGYSDVSGSAEDWRKFWQLAREVDQPVAIEIIQSHDGWRDLIHVRTIAGSWSYLFNTLLPGRIIPADGSRDSEVAIDPQFHEADLRLLRLLDVEDAPISDCELSSSQKENFTRSCRTKFTQRDLPRSPHWHMLNFYWRKTTSGPLDVLEALSDEGKALYTWELLALPSTYSQWSMRHDTQDIYPVLYCESPAIETLRQHGRIETTHGIRPLSDGLGDPPQDPAVLRTLLSHPQANLIRETFALNPDVIDLDVEPIGEDDPIPLVDVWPGLQPYLSAQKINLQLVRCNEFRKFGDISSDEDERDCIAKDGSIIVKRMDDDRYELVAILRELGLHLSDDQVHDILSRWTPADIEAARDAVQACTTDEERLLAAVGETELRLGLPQGLIAILEDGQGTLPGIQVAEAAIATFHTGALREYRHALGHLDPPKQWAGGHRAVEFVRSLGFGEEWAGKRKPQRDPFIEVDGPYSLPNLHPYQRRVVDNMRELLQFDGTTLERRGMVSMPTGSGKTRVAVQAIVETIREDTFAGGVLWVADRDELCEQAVEAWRQVWSSEGSQATQLRISRMWAGQPRPLPSGEMHVVVATIQTLSAKISRQPDEYEFLNNFRLLVFDEAHRSVAPTFISVMAELGLTRWRRAQEPFLIGLTATPYRGHDAAETARLVNRYGSKRLDTGVFGSDDPEEVIRELQTMRILAQADHATIEGGHFYLSDEELQQSRDVPWLPRSVEDRIAHDADRTRRIIEAYKRNIDPSWPTLIFATSVEHSQIVAALLTSMGVKARAVSGNTDTSTRRRVVEEFREGDLKALVNYGVFREGFDAPKTRAIIVARPVYSPNLYFQMIGRGLRGVKNGGNDRCLILNVEDNIENFERKLAFSDLDWLWA